MPGSVSQLPLFPVFQGVRVVSSSLRRSHKLNFYMVAIDRKVKEKEDKKTIGIILCKTKNKVTAEYALSNIQNPMGVATYQTTEALPEDLKGKLPDIKELEARLEEVT